MNEGAAAAKQFRHSQQLAADYKFPSRFPMGEELHKHLHRLPQVFSRDPIFFVSTTTHLRRKILNEPVAAAILIDE
jgi:hypothetical protein